MNGKSVTIVFKNGSKIRFDDVCTTELKGDFIVVIKEEKTGSEYWYKKVFFDKSEILYYGSTDLIYEMNTIPHEPLSKFV